MPILLLLLLLWPHGICIHRNDHVGRIAPICFPYHSDRDFVKAFVVRQPTLAAVCIDVRVPDIVLMLKPLRVKRTTRLPTIIHISRVLEVQDPKQR
ncbi:hypothetical protein B0J13DRAFT_544916 [Dactylonectria estremocensis]|uniref:Secreted protein n=1 Tax=Dactylonectria estremocensis TaxID=1079267 RepID=A0A9P9F895_9HYPO|nr:hypothetical protein B0J13DRAFT_544916 [Dactylonectria estremocensis]